MGPPIYNRLVRSPGTSLDFRLASGMGWEEVVFWYRALHQGDVMLSVGDSVTTKLNCGTPSWCCEVFGGVGKISPTPRPTVNGLRTFQFLLSPKSDLKVNT